MDWLRQIAPAEQDTANTINCAGQDARTILGMARHAAWTQAAEADAQSKSMDGRHLSSTPTFLTARAPRKDLGLK
jgi:vacuolar-type H+-ATPase subunit H